MKYFYTMFDKTHTPGVPGETLDMHHPEMIDRDALHRYASLRAAG